MNVVSVRAFLRDGILVTDPPEQGQPTAEAGGQPEVPPAQDAIVLPTPVEVSAPPPDPPAIRRSASEDGRITSSHGWNPQRIHALAIYCSDGRWGEAFDEYCHESLEIPRYDRFAIPGGPLALTLRDASLMTAYDAARDQIHFLVEGHHLDRIVLITHWGCAAYHRLLHREPDDCLPAQLDDLQQAARTLRGWFAGIDVDAHVAMHDGARVWFERHRL